MPLPKGSVKTRTVMPPALGEGLNREILALKTVSLPLVKLATNRVGPGMDPELKKALQSIYFMLCWCGIMLSVIAGASC